MENLEGREYLDLPTAARLLSVSPSTLRRFIKAGTLKAYRITGGRDLRFRRADVLALVTPDSEEAKEAATPAGLAALMGEAPPAPEASTARTSPRGAPPALGAAAQGRTCELCGAPKIQSEGAGGLLWTCSNPNCPDPPTAHKRAPARVRKSASKSKAPGKGPGKGRASKAAR